MILWMLVYFAVFYLGFWTGQRMERDRQEARRMAGLLEIERRGIAARKAG